jgi:DNA-binding NarL/FixJ family response regulator
MISLMRETVLIVDDHPSFRASARRMLEADGYCVVGELDNGEGVVAAVEKLNPQVVLLDVHLPDIDGFEVMRRLIDANDAPPQMVLVSSHDFSDLDEAVGASGVRGFVAKSELSAEAISLLIR